MIFIYIHALIIICVCFLLTITGQNWKGGFGKMVPCVKGLVMQMWVHEFRSPDLIDHSSLTERY